MGRGEATEEDTEREIQEVKNKTIQLVVLKAVEKSRKMEKTRERSLITLVRAVSLVQVERV